MWHVIAALNSKVSIYLLESKFLFKEDFFNYKKVRELDVVIVEETLELKEHILFPHQDYLFNSKICFIMLTNTDAIME